MIYLDTHVVAWLYAGEIGKLSKEAKTLINNNDLLISPIVRLELQYLFEIQRITNDAQIILSYLSDKIGLKICNKPFDSIINNSINCDWTRDPFDRIIVANAAINKNILVTKDQTILNNYEKAIW